MTKSQDLPAKLREGVFIVVPALNESTCIEEVVRSLRCHYPNVVVIDDGSKDDTAELARRGGATFVLRHIFNCGQGASLQTGIDFALAQGAEYIVTFDGDGQHRVSDILPMLKPIIKGQCEITLGSRFLGNDSVNMPGSRRATLHLAVLFTRLVSGLKVSDAHNGLRAFSRRAAELIRIRVDRMAHASEIIDIVRQTKLPYKEVPVQVHYTPHSLGKRHASWRSFRIAFHYFIARVFQ